MIVVIASPALHWQRAEPFPKFGRVGGVVAWAVMDVALQTGLRSCELAELNVGDFDAKRQSLKVWRYKRKKRKQETIAISKSLAAHLKEFVEWKPDAG